MRTRYFIMLCVLGFILSSVSAAGKGKYLLPYKKGTQWGICDENGTMVLPAKYDRVEYAYPYILTIEPGAKHTINIFDVTARLIDTCYYLARLSGDKLFILQRKHGALQSGGFRGNDARSQNPYRSAVLWRKLETPCSAYIISPDKKQKAIDGTILAIGNNGALAITEKQGRLGIYKIDADSVLQPCVFDSIISIKPDLLLCMKGKEPGKLFDCNGKAYPYHPSPNALYIHKATGNYVLQRSVTPTFRWDTISVTTNKVTGKPSVDVRNVQTGYAGTKSMGDDLISDAGKVLISAERTWEYRPDALSPRYIKTRKSHDSMKEHQSVFQVADLNGNIKIWSAQEIDAVDSNLYHILDIGPEKRDFYYNMATEQILDRPKIVVSQGDEKGIYQERKDGNHIIYNNKGVVIAIIADSNLNYRKWNFLRRIYLKYNDTTARRTKIFGNTYYAFRNSLKEPFIIYDEHYNMISSEYEDLTPSVSSEWISFKKNGKWGLVDNMFREIVPPLYDKMLTIGNGTAIGEASGKKYQIDLHTLRRLKMTGLDAIAEGTFGGHMLGLKYLPDNSGYQNSRNPKVAVLYRCDTFGSRLDSIEVNDDQPYEYCFTGNGNILKYLPRQARAEGYPAAFAYLFKDLHGSSQKTPYHCNSVEKCGGLALLLQCMSEDRKLTLLSANDLSTAVPMGKYSFMFTYPASFLPIDGSGAKLNMLLIKGGTEAMHNAMIDDDDNLMKNMRGKAVPTTDREEVGYFAADGKKYWSE